VEKAKLWRKDKVSSCYEFKERDMNNDV
jgi:hypothetical protein